MLNHWKKAQNNKRRSLLGTSFTLSNLEGSLSIFRILLISLEIILNQNVSERGKHHPHPHPLLQRIPFL